MDLRNISPGVYEAHRKLSKASTRFLEFVKVNPAALLRSSFNILDGKEDVGKLQSWPTFINQYTKREMEQAALDTFNIWKQVPGRIFANDPFKISKFFEIPEEIAKIQLDGVTNFHIDNLLGRGDFIFSPTGLKCLEFNVSAKIGGLQVAYWEHMYANIPVIAKFLAEYHMTIRNPNALAILLEHLLDNALEKIPLPSLKETGTNIVFVFPRYGQGFERTSDLEYLNRLYKNLLNAKFKRGDLKGEVIFCDYQHLHIAGNNLLYKDKCIQVLVEMYHGVIPGEIWEIFKAGNLCVYNGAITKLLSNKLNLAALSQYADAGIFTREEQDIIKRYIPWSRKSIAGEVTYNDQKEKLEDLVFSNKERLVLKPCMGFSGSGIHIGKNTPGDQWKKVAQKAFSNRNWLVQEFVPSFSYIYQKGAKDCGEHILALGLFVFGPRYGGAWARVLSNEKTNQVINSIQGAEESVLLQIEE